MKPMTAFRLTALSCLWFAAFSLLPSLRVWLWSPVLTVVAILLTSMIAVRFERPIVRLPFALLPLVTVWYAWREGLLISIVCAVPTVVIAVAHTADRAMLEYWRARREFLVLAAIGLLLSILMINPILYSAQSYAYIAAFLLFGVLAMRTGRIGSFVSFRWQAGNVGIFALTFAASAGVGVGLMFGFDALLKWLKQLLVEEPREIVHGTPNIIRPDHVIVVLPSFMTESTAAPYDVFTEPPDETVLTQTKQVDIWLIVVGVLAVIALVILIWLLFAHQKHKKEQPETLEMETEDADRKGRGKRRRRGRRQETNNDKVRELYRRYLEYLRMKGVAIRRSETTHDISEHAAKIAEDDTQLRELYRKARYGLEGELLTDEEVQTAQDCYLRLIAAKRDGDNAEKS